MNTNLRNCRGCKTEYVVDETDQGFYQKMGVPVPALCPLCRFRRRAVWRNERTLYKRTCALCNRSIITMYSPKFPAPVYCNDCWASDKWDPRTYARDYDTSRLFFDQLGELLKVVPQSATYSSAAIGPNINSEYTNFAGGNKDAYLCSNSGPQNENIAYSRGLIRCRGTFDTYFAEDNERVYEGINANKNSSVIWAQNTNDCLDSWFLLNCSGCSNCFGCVNLRHGQYQFFNEKLPKEEYLRRVGEIIGSYSKTEEAKKRFVEHTLKFPRRENNNLKAIDCTGDYIFESKDCRNCFEIGGCENLSYCFSVKLGKDCLDMLGHCRRSELLLEGVGVGVSQRVIGSWWVETAHDVEYSVGTRNAEYCFGCVSLKGAKLCILNKQYSEREYRDLRAKIVEELKRDGEYGLFFPPRLAFFAYNETIGMDTYPITKEEALAAGFRWEDDIPQTRGKETLSPEKILDHIRDAPETIVNEILKCVQCARNYRLTRAEFEFYKRMLIPIPRQCWQCRFSDRIRRRGTMTVYERLCAKCGKPIKTSFAPDRPEIVYCESCYQREVV